MLWEDLQRLRPHNLKISPVAVVPQTGQRGRIILDVSFPVYQAVNEVVTAVHNFAYILPQEAGEPCQVVVPVAVQMGWLESPSHFCTVTETARDITQHCVDHLIALPHDPIEESMTIVDVPLRG